MNTVKSHKREWNCICNRLTTRLSENKTTAANPPALGYIFWNVVCLLSPPALPLFVFQSLLYIISSKTPYCSLSFIFPCCLPLHAMTVFLSSATVSLLVTPTYMYLSPLASPSSLSLWWIIHQSVYVINQHLFKKDMIGGAAEVGDGRVDIDRSWWWMRRGRKWQTRDGKGKKKGRESKARENVTMEIRRPEEGKVMKRGERKRGQGR